MSLSGETTEELFASGRVSSERDRVRPSAARNELRSSASNRSGSWCYLDPGGCWLTLTKAAVASLVPLAKSAVLSRVTDG